MTLKIAHNAETRKRYGNFHTDTTIHGMILDVKRCLDAITVFSQNGVGAPSSRSATSTLSGEIDALSESYAQSQAFYSIGPGNLSELTSDCQSIINSLFEVTGSATGSQRPVSQLRDDAES